MAIGRSGLRSVATAVLSSGLAFCACSGGSESGDAESDTTDTGSASPNTAWVCDTFVDSQCECREIELRRRDEPPPPTSCEFFDCCLFEEAKSGDRCTCLETTASCDAEAESRPGSDVIAECPPPGTVSAGPAGPCAKEGENCSSAYLDSKRLDGCCEGSICDPNEEGVPVCRTGTADELALLEQCRRAAARDGLSAEDLMVLDPLVTDVGSLVFDDLLFPSVEGGPGGGRAGVSPPSISL